MGSDKVAISVKGLGKKYSIGGPQEKYLTFRDAIVNSVKAPFRCFSTHTPPEEFWALKDVSFDVEQGEVVGIIGRNGAGKSTLLKILSRITAPTEGTVDLYGRVGSLLEVGTGFHQELTGRENIFLSGSILGMKRREIDAKLDEIVKFSEIEKFLDTPVKRYSSGMYVRLAFSVAAHLDTEILLVDEVLAVGDASFQKKCLGKMGDVAANEGRTVLFVSHNMAAINSLCKKGILLNKGIIEKYSNIDDVTSYYIETSNRMTSSCYLSDPQSAPGDEKIKIKSVKIYSNNELTSSIPINQEVCIEIVYWCLQEGLRITASIHLLDKYGTPVFATGNLNSATLNKDEYANQPFPIGIFRSTSIIPGNLLNTGIYSINVILLTDVTNVSVWLREVVSFEIFETGEMCKEYQGGWIGVIRPKLEWHTNPQD
jgi:lipopolysaccharide transport system ATP-binding protein